MLSKKIIGIFVCILFFGASVTPTIGKDISNEKELPKSILRNSNVPLNNNLVGYWNFDEGSGDIAYDSSGYGNDGYLTNMDTSSCWVNGISGLALDFDGDDDLVIVPDSSSLDVTGAITLEGWFNADTIVFILLVSCCSMQ